MSHATRWICSLLVLAACAGPQGKFEDPDAVESEYRELNGSFEKVWRATQLALAEYPIRVNNQETGIIETESIRGDQGFRVPGTSKTSLAGRKYKINIRVYRPEGDAKHTHIVLRKNIEVQKDFFSAAEPVASDGLEELAIMYRIERELNIDKAADQQSLDL